MREITIDVFSKNQEHCVGYQTDNEETKLTFSGLSGSNNFLKWELDDKKYYELPLTGNSILVTNILTKYAGIFNAQVVTREGKRVANTNPFKCTVMKSVGGTQEKEIMPEAFENEYQQIKALHAELERKLAEGEFIGESAYEVAVRNGFKGSEALWLDTLKVDLTLNTAIKETATGNPCVIDDSADWHLIDCKVHGSTSQAENPTPTDPKEVVNGVVKSISNTGANLIEKISAGDSRHLKFKCFLKDGENYTAYSDDELSNINVSDKDGQRINATFNTNRNSFKVTYTGFYYISFNNGEGKPEIDEKALGLYNDKQASYNLYEPYKGQTITFSKPVELAEDESIEKVDGVYSKVTPTGSTPLPLVDQQALESLQTFYPNTTFTTDTGITLEPTYVADTKNWVLKQINKASQKADQQLVQTMSLLPNDVQATMIDNDLKQSLEEIK